MNEPKPYSITFFPNGMCCVGDNAGNQIPKYNGRHDYSVKALAHDGYDWSKLPDVWGVPSGALSAF